MREMTSVMTCRRRKQEGIHSWILNSLWGSFYSVLHESLQQLLNLYLFQDQTDVFRDTWDANSTSSPEQVIEGSSVKSYDSIQKLLNEMSHLKQAVSAADRLRLFPTLHRLNSAKRAPPPPAAKISSLPEEAEDEVHDTRL